MNLIALQYLLKQFVNVKDYVYKPYLIRNKYLIFCPIHWWPILGHWYQELYYIMYLTLWSVSDFKVNSLCNGDVTIL